MNIRVFLVVCFTLQPGKASSAIMCGSCQIQVKWAIPVPLFEARIVPGLSSRPLVPMALT